MVADGGVVKAKLILDRSDFSSVWKKALKELDTRINGPNFSNVKKELDDTSQSAKKTKENVDQINNSRFDKASNSLDELVRKVKGLQSSVKPLNFVVKPANLDETIRKIRELGSQSKKSEEQVKQINNSRFDRLVSNLDGVINKMRNAASSGVTSIKNDINSGLNAVNFNNLSNKFSATIKTMENTASAGAKSIVNKFSNMEAGLTDIFAAVAGGAGLQQIFTYGMGRATTQAMLSNSKSPQDASTIMEQYQKYTIASSTQDTDIQRVLKYVIQGAPPTQTFQALSAIDAAAFTPDPIQRQELLRNYGQYLTSGYSAALFRGDVTPEEAAILQAAQTPEQRIAAMETIAKNKGSMTETGENLSTLTTGPMANYNKALIIADSLLRGMTEGFNKFMDAISPLMDWFIALDPKAQNTIGNLIFFAGILGMAGGAVKILGTVFGPFIGILKSVGSGALTVAQKLGQMIPTDKITSVLGKLKDAAGNGISSMSDKIVQGLSGLKDKVSGPINTVKDAITSKFSELEQWIRNRKSSTSTTSTTSGTGGSGSLGVGGAIALTAMAVYVTADAIYAYTKAREKYEETGDPVRSSVYGVGTFAENLPLPWLLNTIFGRPSITAEGEEQKGWEKSLDFLSFFGQNPLDSIFPKPVSAAGGSGNQGIMNDIFGKNGALDFSRFGIKIPQFKWPTVNDIKNGILSKLPKLSFKLPSVNDIINSIKGKIPNLKWNIPGIPAILGQTWDRINPLNWKIPTPGNFLAQTWDKIKELWWKIPNPGDFLSQTWQKIKELWWQIPGAGDILGLISRKIGDFHWPWGPAPAGGGSGGGGGRAFGPPMGPASDQVVATMAARSGVGSGYIANAMANRFSGLSGFRAIADGMAAPLNYQFYFGDQKTNQQVWDSGLTNCYDGAQFLQAEASQRFGLGAGLQNGVWDGTSIAHTWSVIGGQPFDMAAKLIRGHWAPPSGPGLGFSHFMTDIGPGLEYMAYEGHLIDPMTALSNGGNCFDMSLGVMGAASLAGLPSELVWGHWNNQSHVWARVAGTDYDPARRAIAGTYNPPPQGPGINQLPNLDINVYVKIAGPVNGIDDLNHASEKAGEKAGAKIASRIFGHYGG